MHRVVTRAFAGCWLVIAAIAGTASAQPVPVPVPPPVEPAPPVASAAEVEALRVELAALRAALDAVAVAERERGERIERLDSELGAERGARLATARAAAAEAPAVTVAAGKVKISLGMFVQVDTVVIDQASVDELDPSTREPLNQDRILLRRGRLRVDVDGGMLGGVLELDANTINGPATRVIGAEVHLDAPWRGDDLPTLQGVAGLFRIPFGFETRQTYRERLFLEPSNAVRALFPGEYDLGLGVRGSWRWLRVQAAVMNGQPTGSRAFPARDPESGKDVVGRVAVVVGRTVSKAGQVSRDARGVGVEVGVSAVTGDGLHPGTASSKDTLVWRDGNEDGLVQLSELTTIPGTAATPSETFGRFAIGGDLRVVGALGPYGEVTIYGEVIRAENLDRAMFPADPVAATRDLRELGVMVAATWEAPLGGLAGLRYDRYDPDADAFEQQAGAVVPRDPVVSTLAVALGWRLRGSGRVLLEYDRERNPFGRDAAGEPASRADDGLTLRVEAAF